MRTCKRKLTVQKAKLLDCPGSYTYNHTINFQQETAVAQKDHGKNI